MTRLAQFPKLLTKGDYLIMERNLAQIIIILMVSLMTACGGATEPPASETNQTDVVPPTTQPAQPAEEMSPDSLPADPTTQNLAAADLPAKLRPEVRGVDFGYTNAAGDWVIEPQFEAANPFFEGLAAVSVDRKWGFIDQNGAVVVEPQFNVVQDFSEGLAAVMVEGQWGYIDQTGQQVIEPQFEYADSFSEGLASVVLEDLAGYIDQTGQLVIEPQYEWAQPFSEGLAAVSQESLFGYIDQTGQMVIEPQFQSAGDFSEGLAAVQPENLYGYIDPTGQMVIEPQFEWAANFSEGLAVIGQDNLAGYVDSTGQIVVAPQYQAASSFSDGLAAVQQDNLYGYIDQTGQVVVEPQFEWAGQFSDGLAFVTSVGGSAMYIDTTGQAVINVKPPEQVIIGETIDLAPENVSFDYRPVAEVAKGRVRPATPISPGPGAGGAMPAHLRFNFDDEELSDWFWPRERQLLIYPVEGYQAILDEIGGEYLTKRISALETMITEQPETIEREIPMLPFVPAAQVFRAQKDYLTFKNGAGVRFLTMYSQGPSPVTNEAVFYTFQGLTSDGQYYVSFVYPVSSSLLPDTFEDTPAAEDFDAFMEGYDSYLDETSQSLNQATGSEFTPDLTTLDELVQTLQVGVP